MPLGVLPHGSKFMEHEAAAEKSHAFLTEDCRPRGVQLDCNRDQQHDWPGHKEKQERQDDIENSLKDEEGLRRAEAVGKNQLVGGKPIDPDLPAHALECLDRTLYFDSAKLQSNQCLRGIGV